MFGWINDCIESMVLSKFGPEIWDKIKAAANCTVANHGWIRHEYYSDTATLELVGAAHTVLGLEVDVILEVFGQYFMEFVRAAGYENLLRCQGSSLKQWLANLNDLHDHLESNLKQGFVKPEFWCIDGPVDTVSNQPTIILHYFSQRGSLLAPIVVGIVKEISKHYFCMEIEMTRIALQGENESKFTSWQIMKLRELEESSAHVPDYFHSVTRGQICSTDSYQAFQQYFEFAKKESPKSENSKCPFFSGLLVPPSAANTSTPPEAVPPAAITNNVAISSSSSSQAVCPVGSVVPNNPSAGVGLDPSQVQHVFPYHIAIDENFNIIQCGSKLQSLLTPGAELLQKHVGNFFSIVSPPQSQWSWSQIGLSLDGQSFALKLISHRKEKTQGDIVLKGGLLILSNPFRALFLVSPSIDGLKSLVQMELSLSDISSYGFQREIILIREHLSSEVAVSYKLDVLSKQLDRERHLSESLLDQMLPRKVADDLRAGRPVPPEHFEHVTIFFSDIVGFTRMASQLEARKIIDLLNILYCLMDNVAKKFSLYKVETIGDAYMVCSGLPQPDVNHAINVANFALIVQSVVGIVTSPLDDTPIQIRMGIHSGSVMAGVVGNLMPRYCLFGDTVNTASRHESTGEAGRIHCSQEMVELLEDTGLFVFSKRGDVDMKGKGLQTTYWLESATALNVDAGEVGLASMVAEAEVLLETAKSRRPSYSNVGAYVQLFSQLTQDVSF